jgi:hypothetical protein
MTTRTTRAQLDELAEIINRRLDLAGDRAYTVEYAYGRPRLERAGGSVDVSPRLPAGELAQWMRAFMGGMDATRSPYRGPTCPTCGGSPVVPLPPCVGVGATYNARFHS